MKLRIPILVLFIALFSFSGFAQKPKKESIGKYSFVQQPLRNFPADFKKYLLSAETQWNDPYRKDQMYDQFFIAGYEKVRSGDHQFKIKIIEYPLRTSNKKLETSTTTTKKDGVERKVTKYYYSYMVQYKIRVEILDAAQNSLYSQSYDLGGSRSTSEYSTSNEAYKQYSADISKLRGSILNSAIQQAAKDIDNQYGYPIMSYNLYAYNVKPKKYDYPEYTKAIASLKAAMAAVSGNENNTEAAKAKCVDLHKDMEKAAVAADLKSKKARINAKVAAATYYNMGIAYLLEKDFDNAEAMMNKAHSTKKNTDAPTMIKIIQHLRERAPKQQ